ALCVLLLLIRLVVSTRSFDSPTPPDELLFLDFDEGEAPQIRLLHGGKRVTGNFGAALEFTDALQFAEIDFSHRLDGVTSMTVGGWFLPRRAGEQSFLFRGVPRVGPNGERMFPPGD